MFQYKFYSFILSAEVVIPLSPSPLSLPLSLKISGKLPGAESVAQKHFGQLTAANCCAYKAIKQRERREEEEAEEKGEAEEEEEAGEAEE